MAKAELDNAIAPAEPKLVDWNLKKRIRPARKPSTPTVVSSDPTSSVAQAEPVLRHKRETLEKKKTERGAVQNVKQLDQVALNGVKAEIEELKNVERPSVSDTNTEQDTNTQQKEIVPKSVMGRLKAQQRGMGGVIGEISSNNFKLKTATQPEESKKKQTLPGVSEECKQLLLQYEKLVLPMQRKNKVKEMRTEGCPVEEMIPLIN